MSRTGGIRLGQYLKLAGLVGTGGEAKQLIQNGQVRVNGEVETRRKRMLCAGDRITLGHRTLIVNADPSPVAPDQEKGASSG
jgi:ribosome-associated protein